MLTFDVSVSGGQVGRQLANDAEELAYALAELSDGFPEDLAEEVIGLLPYGKEAEVKAMLLKLVEAIDQAT